MVKFLIFLFSYSAFAGNSEVIPGEYLVKFKHSYIKELANSSVAKKLNIQIIHQTSIPDVFLIKNKNVENQEVTISRLKADVNVQIVEPNYIYKINRTPNDPELGKLWGLINSGQNDSKKNIGLAGVDIGAEKAWDIQTGNQELIVAVIDTGVDYNHGDLIKNIWNNDLESNGKPGVDDDENGYIDDIHGYDFVNQDGDPMDDHGHGSHCSGTIGAKGDDNSGIVGVAWNVKIMGVKFLSKDGSGSLEAAIEAIKYATKMGAKVMSNSWGGGGYSELLKNAIQEANDKGVVFTAAAGNHSGNNDETPSYPASYNIPNVISVAAVDNRGGLANFSCFGRNTVHVAAPGVNVYSSIPRGYDSWSGTSMATPHVSGVVALLLSQEPGLTPEEVKSRLIKTSKPLVGLKGKVASNGIIDAYLSLTNQVAPPDINDPSSWKNFQDLSFSTQHPYTQNTNQSFEIEISGAKEISLFFEKFVTELRYDKATFYNREGKKVGELSGDLGEIWSPIISGDFVKVTFSSDESINKYGFDLTKAAYR